MTETHVTQPTDNGNLTANSSAPDPIVEYAREIARLSEDEAARRYELEKLIATNQATSLPGAAVQIMLANTNGNIADLDPQPFLFRQIDTCLVSAMAALEAHTGTECPGIGNYTVTDDMDAARAAIRQQPA